MNRTDSTASEQIQETLAQRARESTSQRRAPGATIIEADTPIGHVSASIEDSDRLGVLAGPVTARRTDGKTGSVGAQAREAVRRLNYLQEPLTIVETEEARGRAIVRSEAPRSTRRGREYNEAVLQNGDAISIRRYRAEGGSRRKAVPSNLSRETLGRLADDLLEIVGKD